MNHADGMDELETARAIASGQLTSPQRIGTLVLYAMRVSGTGVSYRRGLDEFVWRDPAVYLSQDMIDRCAGLPVIMEHPESSTLNSEEFSDRVVGVVMFGYVKDDELWCVARIYDDESIEMMEKDQLSTSPAVVFKDPSVNSKMTLKGKTVLIEGKPSLLDHLAICERGVWDKGGPATGIDVVRKDSAMTEEEKKVAADKARHDAEEKERAEAEKKADADAGEKIDKVLAHLDSLGKRMDAYDAQKDAAKADAAKADAEEKEKEEKEKADKAKKDAEEKEEKGDPEKLAADKAKKDEEMAADKAKKDAEEKECAEKEKVDSARKDSEANMQKMIADLQARIPKQRSDNDFAAIADAQSYWDKAYSGFSKDAPRPMDGETTLAYRRRCAKDMRKHSPSWKDTDLDVISIDANAFKIVESAIYADSLAAANDPMNIPEDTLMERVNVDRLTGQRSITFHGSPSAWTNQFKSGKQFVGRFQTGNRGDR